MGKSCGGARAFGTESATRGSCCGPELDGEKLWRRQVFGARMGARKERKVFCFIQRGQVFGARMSETMSETNGKKLLFFSRDSEAAFGSERATRGGSFWTRIRLGKGVAGSGVRGSRSAGAKGRPGGWLGRESDGEKLWRRQGVWD